MPSSFDDPSGTPPEEQFPPAGAGDAPAKTEAEIVFLKRLLEGLPYPVWYVDAHLIYRRCNAAAAATVGRTPDEIIGQSVAAVVGADSEVIDLLRRVIASAEPHSGTVESNAAGSSSATFYRVSYLPDIDAEGTVVGVLTSFVDVTDLVHGEQALRENEGQSAFLLQLSDALRPLSDPIAVQETASRLLGEHLGADRAGYFEIDGDDCVIERDWAPSVPHLSGRFPVAAIGEDLMSIYRAGRMVVMNDIAEEPLTRAEREAYSAIGVAAQISIPLIKNGDFAGGLTVHSAVPRAWTPLETRLLEETAERTWAAVEWAKAESELREGEERYRQLFESESDALFLIDQETGRIIDANAAAAEMYGYEPAELLCLADVDLSAEPDLTRDRAHPAAAVENVRVPLRRHRRRDGTEFFVEITGRIFSLRGRPVRIAAVRDVSERIRTEEALRETEDLYRSILRASPDDITVTDLEGRILLVSAAAVSMLGHEREEEMLGRPMLDYLAPEDRQRAEANLGLMFEGVYTGPGEYVAVRADGTRFPIEVNGEFTRDALGRPTGMVFIVRDVTQRNLAEEALRASEERFRVLFEDHRAVMLLVEPDSGQIIDVNEAAARFYGYSREQLRAMRIQQINQLPAEEVAAERHRALGGGQDTFTFPHRLASGEVRAVEVYSTPVMLEGRPTLFSIIHDVTARRQAEEALRESETRFDSLFENSPDAVFLTMPDGAILHANPAARRMFGRSEDELREKGRSVLFEAGDPRLAEALEERRRTGRLRAVELRAIRKNGERFPIELDSVVLPGEPERTFVIVRDVTERKLAEQALRESEAKDAAQQERGRLARDLHDSVTQALFAASLKAEALAIASVGAGDGAAAADEVRRLNRGALAEMRTLLLELRGDPVEAVPLPNLLRNLVEAAESRARVKVVLTLDEEAALPPKVHEAVYRITQEALNNVVRHAKAPNVWVQLRSDPTHARLVIGDDGCGFDPGSVDPSHFGLKTMRERVRDSGGQLAVRSVAGEGTTVEAEWRFDESRDLAT